MAVEKNNILVSPKRDLIPNSSTVTKHGDEIVRASIKHIAGQVFSAEASNWLLRLEEAKRLKSGWRGLIPSNRVKAKAIEAQILADIRHPGFRVAVKTFDEERATLAENAWLKRLNSLGLGDLEDINK